MNTSRTSFVQLPSGKELQEILNKEAVRAVSKEKEDLHYVNFEPIILLLKKLGLNSDFFTKTFNTSDFYDEALVSSVVAGLEEVIGSAIKMINSEGDRLRSELDNLYDYLSEEDKPEKSDIVFVFGSKSTLRTEKAIELYKSGLAPKLLISGKGPIYESGEGMYEAETMKNFAIADGLPVESILIEKNSISIPDNVKSSLNYLDSIGLGFSSLILVNSPFAQRRGWAHFKKYLPDSMKIYRVNSGVGEKYSKDAWFKSEEGIKVIINEYIKMKVATVLNTA